MSKSPIEKLSGFCVIIGASSGIGFELAKLAARDDCDLLLVADRGMEEVASALRDASFGMGSIDLLECDLSTQSGIGEFIEKIAGRQVDVLMANAGQSKGGAFLDHDWIAIKHRCRGPYSGYRFHRGRHPRTFQSSTIRPRPLSTISVRASATS